MMHQYTVALFNPSEAEWRPIRTRVVQAESEDEAIDSLGDTGDSTYWEVIDTDDPRVTRIHGGC